MEKTYTTIAGDMWDSIAYKATGDDMNMDKIMKANLQHRETYIFDSGVEIIIPEIKPNPAVTLPPWKRGPEYAKKAEEEKKRKREEKARKKIEEEKARRYEAKKKSPKKEEKDIPIQTVAALPKEGTPGALYFVPISDETTKKFNEYLCRDGETFILIGKNVEKPEEDTL